MEQPVPGGRNRFLSCLCCWSCWSSLLWSFISPDERPPYESNQPNRPPVQQGTQSSDERRRLLPETPKLYPTQRLDDSDQKRQLQIAGVPKFPGEESTLSKTYSHVSMTDLVNDACPTCLELYTEENPKITTKCGHHFHLACIYEWLERANTCPVCFKPMKFDELQ